MQSIDLIRLNLTQSIERVLMRVEDMREHAVEFPTPNGGAHTLWVLGHIAFIESQVVHQFLRGGTNPLASWEPVFDGSEVSGTLSDGTYRLCLQFVADHTYMHRGQLADARRAAGLARMWV